MFTVEFWKRAAERAGKTAGQAFILAVGAEQMNVGLWFPKQTTGVTVYKTAEGTWGAGQWLDDAFLATCERVYRGGYTYTLDSTEVSELTAAGYGTYIT